VILLSPLPYMNISFIFYFILVKFGAYLAGVMGLYSQIYIIVVMRRRPWYGIYNIGLDYYCCNNVLFRWIIENHVSLYNLFLVARHIAYDLMVKR
jgi:hypothetical protein